MKKKFDIKYFIAHSIYERLLGHPMLSFIQPYHSLPYIEVFDPTKDICKSLRELSLSSKDLGYSYFISVECATDLRVSGPNSLASDMMYHISMPNNPEFFKEVMYCVISMIQNDIKLRSKNRLNDEKGGVK